MAFDREAFMQVVERSRLTKPELAVLYDTTRQTIYNWMGGGEPTNRLLVHFYNNISAGLVRAMSRKLLPYSVNLSKEERKQRVDAMRKILHAQK